MRSLIFLGLLVAVAGCTAPPVGETVPRGPRERLGATPSAALGDAGAAAFQALADAPQRERISAEDKKRFDEAKAHFAASEFTDAAEKFEKVYRFSPRSALAQESLFQAAESWFAAEKHDRALDLYERLLREYPRTERYPETLDRIFQIGKLFAEEKAKKSSVFLGVRVTDRELGIEVLERFVKQRDRHPSAPEALLVVGEAHERAIEPELAIETWQRLVKEYPSSSWSRLAEYRIALAFISLSYGIEYDKRPILTGLRRLRSYVRKYPTGDKVAEAEAKVRELEEALAAHDLGIAKKYAKGLLILGEDRYYSARIYLDSIRREYPKTQAAVEAAQLDKEWPPQELPPPKPESEDDAK